MFGSLGLLARLGAHYIFVGSATTQTIINERSSKGFAILQPTVLIFKLLQALSLIDA